MAPQMNGIVPNAITKMEHNLFNTFHDSNSELQGPQALTLFGKSLWINDIARANKLDLNIPAFYDEAYYFWVTIFFAGNRTGLKNRLLGPPGSTPEILNSDCLCKRNSLKLPANAEWRRVVNA